MDDVSQRISDSSSTEGKLSLVPDYAKSVSDWVYGALRAPDGYRPPSQCIIDAAMAEISQDPIDAKDASFVFFVREYKRHSLEPNYDNAWYRTGIPKEDERYRGYAARLIEYFRKIYAPENLWLDQKVGFLVSAAEGRLFPDLAHGRSVDKRIPNEYKYHRLEMSCSEWLGSGKERFLETYGGAFVREIERIDFSRFDLDQLRPYIGDDIELCAGYAEAVMRAKRLKQMQAVERAVASVTAKAASMINAREASQRLPYHHAFSTYAEVVDLTVYEESQRRSEERKNKVIDFLFGW